MMFEYLNTHIVTTAMHIILWHLYNTARIRRQGGDYKYLDPFNIIIF